MVERRRFSVSIPIFRDFFFFFKNERKKCILIINYVINLILWRKKLENIKFDTNTLEEHSYSPYLLFPVYLNPSLSPLVLYFLRKMKCKHVFIPRAQYLTEREKEKKAAVE